MTLNIFDFTHTEGVSDFKHSKVRVRIRLQHSWVELLREVGFSSFEFLEDWNYTVYSKQTSRRQIAAAKK
jgi:hypothetical protein